MSHNGLTPALLRLATNSGKGVVGFWKEKKNKKALATTLKVLYPHPMARNQLLIDHPVLIFFSTEESEIGKTVFSKMK